MPSLAGLYVASSFGVGRLFWNAFVQGVLAGGAMWCPNGIAMACQRFRFQASYCVNTFDNVVKFLIEKLRLPVMVVTTEK